MTYTVHITCRPSDSSLSLGGDIATEFIERIRMDFGVDLTEEGLIEEVSTSPRPQTGDHPEDSR